MTSLYEETKLYILRNGHLLGIRYYSTILKEPEYTYKILGLYSAMIMTKKDLVYYFGLLGMLSGLLGVRS